MRLPLVIDPLDRDGTRTKDARLVNCVVELLDEGSPKVRQRPGTSNYSAVTAAGGRGMYYWSGHLYSVFGTTLYKDGVAVSGTIAGTDQCSFVTTLGATPYLVIQNSSNLYYYDGTTLTTLVSAGYPSSTVRGVAYLDGYVCVATSGAQIYQSGIDDPSTWSGDYISADVDPDNAVMITSHINYVTVFGDYSVEFFYDAANAVGSPFSRFSGTRISFGCAYANSVGQGDGVLGWVAQSRIGGLFVALMDGTSPKRISTGPIEKILESENKWADINGMVVRCSGHLLYIITAYTASYADSVTLVYDIISKKWYEWKGSGINYFPYIATSYAEDAPIIQHLTNGKIDYISDRYTNDDGTAITADIYTPIFDGGTIARKFCGNATVIGDQITSSTVNVSFSDDDYQTESTAVSVDMSSNRPFVAGQGSFYRRSYHLNFDTPNRLDSLELNIVGMR